MMTWEAFQGMVTADDVDRPNRASPYLCALDWSEVPAGCIGG